jgi:DNA-binding HxlR family transcriptional regulator
MRKQPPFADKIVACLERHGPLGYAAIMAAAQAPNSPTTARSLRNLKRRGIIVRHVLTELRPPRVLYALSNSLEGDRSAI